MEKTKLQEEYTELIQEGRFLDFTIVLILTKRLLKPIKKWDAYKMGLIDEKGNSIKKPETPAEKNALTILDKLILKIKGLMTPRNLMALAAFLVLKEDTQLTTDENLIVEKVKKERKAKDVYNSFRDEIEEHFENEDDFWNSILKTKL
jgi:hypothetical protein